MCAVLFGLEDALERYGGIALGSEGRLLRLNPMASLVMGVAFQWDGDPGSGCPWALPDYGLQPFPGPVPRAVHSGSGRRSPAFHTFFKHQTHFFHRIPINFSTCAVGI